ncbi:MAG: hypothetical protein KJ995_06685 [Candidatus Omnitrophica bacterium]|nr:hypothetical protein [Candidatus Omnitrophota bacterium]MBU1128189.1 hypothetical protein [Candidatus Omnitrophota bacterium]MBU1785187.1 hypothetical protein [Candidatus Omnitrophota bacterium]MBU1852068.1 hypothetical protein [Candidatus Omnitrophota bacterium]
MWYGIIGVISLVLSFLYFFKPEAVKKIDKIGSKPVFGSEKMLQWKKLVAFFYLIGGIVLIYIEVYGIK